jgi:hypothetical protein
MDYGHAKYLDVLQGQKATITKALERLEHRTAEVRFSMSLLCGHLICVQVLYQHEQWFTWVRECQNDEEENREKEQKKVKMEAALFKRHVRNIPEHFDSKFAQFAALIPLLNLPEPLGHSKRALKPAKSLCASLPSSTNSETLQWKAAQQRLKESKAKEDKKRQDAFLEKVYKERLAEQEQETEDSDDTDWDPIEEVLEDNRGSFIGKLSFPFRVGILLEDQVGMTPRG